MPIESLLKQHIERVIRKELDLKEFLAKAREKFEICQKRFAPFITIPATFDAGLKKGLLTGVPVAVKDNICTSGIRTTAGSKILDGYTPQFDAACIASVKKEGGIVAGKTAMDEFGFGTFSTNCAFGTPKNPIDETRSCGGSSGGAAAIVAAFDGPVVSLAESTGGSITCPAAFTGTVGLTPTYGRVSRWGLVDYANSLDKIGVIGKCVYDTALLLSVIAGHDSRDSTSAELPKEDFTKYPRKKKSFTIGVPKEYFSDAVNEQVRKEVWRAVKALEKEGLAYKEISLKSTELAIPTYYVISMSEASTNLAKYCGLRYGLQLDMNGTADEYFSSVRSQGFGDEAKRRIILGTYMRMAGYRDKYYAKAMVVRTKIIEEFNKAFGECDVLLTPSMPVVAPKLSEIAKLTPTQNYMMDVLTVAPNLAGTPTLSVPFSKVEGLPIGVQLIARHFEEGSLFRVGSVLEECA